MKQYKIKNGEIITVRLAEVEDATKIIEYVNMVAAESDNLTFGEGEFNTSLEDEIKLIREFQKSQNSIFLVAELNGEIVSLLSFIGGKRPRIQHAGEFGISVLKEYWGLGIARQMLNYLIDWANNSNLIRKINLKVRVDNTTAIKLYEDLGFKHEGRLSRFFYINDCFYDVYEMGLEID